MQASDGKMVSKCTAHTAEGRIIIVSNFSTRCQNKLNSRCHLRCGYVSLKVCGRLFMMCVRCPCTNNCHHEKKNGRKKNKKTATPQTDSDAPGDIYSIPSPINFVPPGDLKSIARFIFHRFSKNMSIQLTLFQSKV